MTPRENAVSQDPSPPSSRDKILETCEALFARHGFSGVGMRAVAEAVGLSKSALFHHFPSKSELYTALHEFTVRELDERLERASRGLDDPREKALAWIDAVVDAMAEHPSRAPLLLRSLFESDVVTEEQHDRVDRALVPILARVASLLGEGIEQGLFRSVSIPHTIQTLIGMTVYHFASGEFGDRLFERPIFSAEEIRRRKEHVRDFLTHAVFA